MSNSLAPQPLQTARHHSEFSFSKPHTTVSFATTAASTSTPCGVSSRAFKTAMTRPRWVPESFSRPMTITSPPCLGTQVVSDGEDLHGLQVLAEGLPVHGAQVMLRPV